MLIEAVLRVPRGPVGRAQWRTFVEIIRGDESLHHQLKRQNRVNFWGVLPPRLPTSVLFGTLSLFKSFETINMNFFNYYRLEQYLQSNMPVQKIS